MFSFTRYQWIVLLAAWLGWGFDVFDALLFNYVAPNAVPTLLGLEIGSPEAKAATVKWTGIISSLLLLGWAAGGVIFGWVCDRIGRTKTMLITILLYALGTAACAFATDIWMLLAFRLVAALGIGGEWAAGASIVAETVPEEKRVEAGALLYTAAPFGLFLATFVNMQFAGVWFKDSPAESWRYIFLMGLVPAFIAFGIRLFVHEPPAWQESVKNQAAPRIRELFSPQWRANTLSGFLMAVIALLTWWSCNSFLPVVSAGLAQLRAAADGLDAGATRALIEQWKTHATTSFNLGGLVGTLLTIPIAKYWGRKPMFLAYWLLAIGSIMAAFGMDLSYNLRLLAYFLVGVSVFGIFGSFTFYLPELFPTRLRATGSGFCYNIGRIIAAAGPFVVGLLATRKPDELMGVLFWVSMVPLLGIFLMPWVVETKGRSY